LILPVEIWGIIDMPDPASFTDLSNFVADVETYLSVTWTYKGWTDIIGQRIVEAGPDDLLGIWNMSIRIRIMYARGSP